MGHTTTGTPLAAPPQGLGPHLIDEYIVAGAVVMRLGQLSVDRPDLEIRLVDGVLTVGYVREGRDGLHYQTGAKGIEPEPVHWEIIGLMMVRLPQKEGT